MKLLIFITLSIVLEKSRAEGSCMWMHAAFVWQGHCVDLEFKYNEPLHLGNVTEVPRVEIQNSTGSISAKTLSPLSFTLSLDITDSTISKIEDGALCSLPKLRELGFEGSKLPALTEATLRNCKNLESLNVPDIDIELSALKHMPGLKRLVISNVKVKHLTKSSLGLINPLESFMFSNFEVSSIDSGVLCTPQLTLLAMKNSVLPRLSKRIFKNCNNVIHLNIVGNKIPSIKEGTFTYFTTVAFVLFDGLHVPHLTKKFLTGLNNVNFLEIINSGIRKVSKDAFVGLNKLTRLSLSGNKLRKFDPNTFAVIPNLKQLDLSQNRLRNLDNIKSPVVKKLVVSSNNISTINLEAVKLNLPQTPFIQIGLNDMSIEITNTLEDDL